MTLQEAFDAQAKLSFGPLYYVVRVPSAQEIRETTIDQLIELSKELKFYGYFGGGLMPYLGGK